MHTGVGSVVIEVVVAVVAAVWLLALWHNARRAAALDGASVATEPAAEEPVADCARLRFGVAMSAHGTTAGPA